MDDYVVIRKSLDRIGMFGLAIHRVMHILQRFFRSPHGGGAPAGVVLRYDYASNRERSAPPALVDVIAFMIVIMITGYRPSGRMPMDSLLFRGLGGLANDGVVVVLVVGVKGAADRIQRQVTDAR
jgi:hypothetical protein